MADDNTIDNISNRLQALLDVCGKKESLDKVKEIVKAKLLVNELSSISGICFEPLDIAFAKKSADVSELTSAAQFPVSKPMNAKNDVSTTIPGTEEAPLSWVCKMVGLQAAAPKAKLDLYITEDSFIIHLKGLYYHVSALSLQEVFWVPDPNGEEQCLAISLHTPLLVGKTRVPLLLLRVDRLADADTLSLGDSTAPLAARVSTALVALRELHTDPGPRLVDLLPAVCDAFLQAAGGTLTRPGAAFRSHTGAAHVHCYYKANDGPLYPIRGGLLFLGKPYLWIPAKRVASVEAASRGERSFDLKVSVDGAAKPVKHEFGLISSEEQPALTAFAALLAKWRGDKDDVSPPPPAPVVAAPRAGVRRSSRKEVVASSLGHVRLIDDRDEGSDESEDFDESSDSDDSDDDEDSDGYADDNDDEVMVYEDNEPASKRARTQ